MSSPEDTPTTKPPTAAVMREIDAICDSYEANFRQGQRPDILKLANDFPSAYRQHLLLQLFRLELECTYGTQWNTSENYSQFQQRYPNERHALQRTFAQTSEANDFDTKTRDQSREIRIRCPHCQNAVELAVDSSFSTIQCSTCGSNFSIIDGPTATHGAKSLTKIAQFELIERLGVGGFGTVWKARDTVLQRTVAVKIPRKGQLQPEEVEKFLREARAAAQLTHPNIVRVYEVGRDDDTDTVFIVSDIIRGVTLSDWLTAKLPSKQEAVGLCIAIADALQHAHEFGVVHRDLKPQNIIIDSAGTPFVTDFGLAKRDAGEHTVTIDGQVLGTPAYMPPEQAAGNAHQADGRADIYSLGTVLFQLLTGELPFRGNARMLLHQVLNEDAPSPRRLDSTISRDLETICLKCLEKDREKRYQTAAEMASDLRCTLRKEPISARPISTLARCFRWVQRNTVISALVATVLAVLIAGLATTSWLSVRLSIANAKERDNYVSALLDKTELLLELGDEGYRDSVMDNLQRAKELGGNNLDIYRVRQAAVGAMGDFVGLEPIEHEFGEGITAFALHPTRSLMAIGLQDGTIRFADPLEPTSGRTLKSGQYGPVGAMRFTEDGTHLTCVHSQAIVEVPTDPDNGGTNLLMEGAFKRPRFTADGKHISTRDEKQANVYSLTERAMITSIRNDELFLDSATPDATTLSILSFDYHPTSALAVVNCSDEVNGSRIVLWDTNNRSVLKSAPFEHGDTYPQSLAFSPDGKKIGIGTDRAIAMFDIPSFNQKSFRGAGTTKAVQFSPDTQFMASVDMYGLVTLWGVETGNALEELRHHNGTGGEYISFADDLRLLVAGNKNAVRVWQVGGSKEKQILASHGPAVPSVAFSQSGKRLLTGSKDGTARIYDVDSKRFNQFAVGGEIQAVAFSPDGSKFAVGIWQGKIPAIQIRDAADGRLILNCQHDLGDKVTRLRFIDDRLLAATFMENGGDWRGGVGVWQIPDPADEPADVRPYRELKRANAFCFSIAVSPDQERLAFIEFTRKKRERVLTWNWRNENRPIELAKAPSAFGGWHGLDFMPNANSQEVVFSSKSGQAQRWGVVDQTLVAEIGKKNLVNAPFQAISPDGKWLAVLESSKSIALMNLATSKKQFALPPERADIYALSWSPDSQDLAVGLNDGGVLLWRIGAAETELKRLGFQ